MCLSLLVRFESLEPSVPAPLVTDRQTLQLLRVWIGFPNAATAVMPKGTEVCGLVDWGGAGLNDGAPAVLDLGVEEERVGRGDCAETDGASRVCGHCRDRGLR